MVTDWEQTFKNWARPPGKTEEARCENGIRVIRNAIARSEKLNRRSTKVFVQGSYRNNVNVREDSDIDLGVLCDESFFSTYPEGMGRDDFNNSPATYSYKQFKDELEEALVEYFGRDAVHRGNKAFDLHENTYHVDADVAPFFEYRRYWDDGTYRCGVALLPDQGSRIHNYPERLLSEWPNTPQHYENGVAKNTTTGRSYKGLVRILKKLRNQMDEANIAAAAPIPGFLIECLVWNAPNRCFDPTTWDDRVQAVLAFLWNETIAEKDCGEWHEVNDIKILFHPTQAWTQNQAHAFVDAAWDVVGVRR